MTIADAYQDQHPKTPQMPSGWPAEYWTQRDGRWVFVVDRLMPLELARAAALMAARYGTNAKPRWRGAR